MLSRIREPKAGKIERLTAKGFFLFWFEKIEGFAQNGWRMFLESLLSGGISSISSDGAVGL